MYPIVTIDCEYLGRPRFAAAYLLRDGDEAAFIDNNTNAAVPRLLASYEMGDAHWASGIHAHPTWNAGGGRIYFNARDDNGLPQVYCIELDE